MRGRGNKRLTPKLASQNARATMRHLRSCVPATAWWGKTSTLLFPLVPTQMDCPPPGGAGPGAARCAMSRPPAGSPDGGPGGHRWHHMPRLRHHVRADPQERPVLLRQMQAARLSPAPARKSASAESRRGGRDSTPDKGCVAVPARPHEGGDPGRCQKSERPPRGVTGRARMIGAGMGDRERRGHWLRRRAEGSSSVPA
jgi:hypothetical protein